MLAPPNPLPQTLVRMSLQSPPGTQQKSQPLHCVASSDKRLRGDLFLQHIMLASKEDADDWQAPRSQGFLNHN